MLPELILRSVTAIVSQHNLLKMKFPWSNIPLGTKVCLAEPFRCFFVVAMFA